MYELKIEDTNDLDRLKDLLWGETTLNQIKEVVKGVVAFSLLLFSLLHVLYILSLISYKNIKQVYNNINNPEVALSPQVEVLPTEEQTDKSIKQTVANYTPTPTLNLEYKVLTKLEYKVTEQDIEFIRYVDSVVSRDGITWLSKEWQQLYLDSTPFILFSKYMQKHMSTNEELKLAVKECHENGDGYPYRYSFNPNNVLEKDMLITLSNLYNKLVEAQYA